MAGDDTHRADAEAVSSTARKVIWRPGGGGDEQG
jgi:hypothetical protein